MAGNDSEDDIPPGCTPPYFEKTIKGISKGDSRFSYYLISQGLGQGIYTDWHYAHLKSDSGQTPKGFNSQDDILRAWRFICYESHKHKGSEAHHFVNPFPRASIRPTNTTSDVSYTQGHRHPDDMTDDELAYHLGKAVLISKAQKPASSFIFSNPFLQSSPAPTQMKSRPNSPKKMTPSKAPSSSSSSSSNKGKPHVSTGSPAKNCGKVIGDPFTTMGTTAPVLDYVVRSRSTTRMYTSKVAALKAYGHLKAEGFECALIETESFMEALDFAEGGL